MTIIAIYLLICWAVSATLIASIAVGKYERLRRDWLTALEDPQMPFVRALPPRHDNVLPFRRK